MAQTETWTPSVLAAIISRITKRPVSPKQVRGRARGDSGTPLLARFAPGTKSPYQAHVYSAAEANKIGAAFIEAHNRRSEAHVKWTPLGGRSASTKTKTTKTTTTKPSAAQRVSETPTAPSAATLEAK